MILFLTIEGLPEDIPILPCILRSVVSGVPSLDKVLYDCLTSYIAVLILKFLCFMLLDCLLNLVYVADIEVLSSSRLML